MEMKPTDLYEKALPLAEKVLSFARDSILINMRFLTLAMSALSLMPVRDLGGFSCDGKYLYYDPVYLLKKYKEEPAYALRLYLHVLFHMIFYHGFNYDKTEKEKWDAAADIAVENTILEFALPCSALKRDDAARRKLVMLQEEVSALTAEVLYRYLKKQQPGSGKMEEYKKCFALDDHMRWSRQGQDDAKQEELVITTQQWEKIRERVQAELKSFSSHKGTSESLEKNLAAALKDKYDYTKLLKRFMVMSEDIQINDDEFDYIYYTYGLTHYGNMPLVEPLEYKDSKKVREFVIAIDTSASCRGELVRSFLKKTYSILTGEENFFRKMNVHIIQCDSEVEKDTKITSREDLERFLAHEKLTGFGATDFRPVFSYVGELLKKREFENLKGLIYFTDGYGVYPSEMPPYEVMFVFQGSEGEGVQVPPWAVKVILDDEEQVAL